MAVNKNCVFILAVVAIFLVPLSSVFADNLSLHTETRTGYDPDSNWDWWQQPDPNEQWDPNQHQDPNIAEDALYLCPFDGASGHPDYQPDSPTDGNVDGTYSTLDMGSSGAPIYQSLGVSGTDPNEFPNNQRDTRMVSLFNLSKIAQVNDKAGAVLNCTFKWSVDYVMNWIGGTEYLQAPTTLYVSIFGAEKQQWWRHPPDSNSEPNTPISELQNEFDGDPNTEKALDIRVDDGPWGPGLQPLTDYYIWAIDGPQFYEMDFTEEIRNIIAADPNMMSANPNFGWIGLTIRPSLDGEACYLQMRGGRYPDEAFPPTLDVQVSKYLGDLDDDKDVDFVDFALFARQWKQSSGLLTADLNVDGAVDFEDLGLFCENWLKGKE